MIVEDCPSEPAVAESHRQGANDVEGGHECDEHQEQKHHGFWYSCRCHCYYWENLL